MRVLFLTQLFPYPPVCGGTIKSYNMLKHLCSKHDVTLVSFVRTQPSDDEMNAVRTMCGDVRTVMIRRSATANLRFAVAGLLGKTPFIVARDFVPEMQRTVDDLLRTGKFDLVYVDHLQMAQYVLDWTDCPKLLDEHNVEWKIIERIAESDPSPVKRLYAAAEWRKLRRWELAACEKFDQVLTVSETDRETLLSGNPPIRRVDTVPIGVDLDAFPRIELDPAGRDIVSMGTMSWPPNIDAVRYFADRIYPLIRERVPGVRLVIAGKNPPESVRRLSRDSSIEVTGFVDDPVTIMRRAAAFIVPLRSGSGLRVKILNAMAMGLPVVTTSIGSEGISAVDGRDLMVADTERDFANAVVRLISDFALRQELAESARTFVEENYGWEAIYRRLDAVLSRSSGESVPGRCSRESVPSRNDHVIAVDG